MAGDIIREKGLWLLQEEIPHGIAVVVNKFEESDGLISIMADIVCEKATHKQIIIGKGGGKLGEIGKAARLEMEKIFNKKIYLELFVKVREDWRNRANYVKEFGYDNKN